MKFAAQLNKVFACTKGEHPISILWSELIKAAQLLKKMHHGTATKVTLLFDNVVSVRI